MKLIVVLGVAGALLLVGTMTRVDPESAQSAGSVPEVVVTAEAPCMMLDEVVVRPGKSTGLPEYRMSDGEGLSQPSDEILN